MKFNGPEVGRDAVALITKARAQDDPGRRELLDLAVDQLVSREDESLREALTRETQLVAVLASIAAALADCLDEILPDRIDGVLQRLALKWAGQLEEGGE